MANQNDSYNRLRKCQRCGAGTRMNRAPLPSDACSACGAIYAKVEEALDSDSTASQAKPIAGSTLFLLVTSVVAICAGAVALVGWEGLALALAVTAIYVLNNAKKISKSSTSPWLRRFLAQPKGRGSVWDRMSTLQRIGAFVGIYIAAALLFFFAALPFLSFILTGQF